MTWTALLSITAACGRDRGGAAPEPSDRIVASEWMPVPAFVVPEVPLADGSWMRSSGLSPDQLELELGIEHRVDGGILEVDLFLGDGFVGTFLSLRFEHAAHGRVAVQASGGEHSCVSHEQFLDLHGEVCLERRRATSTAPLCFSFRLDGITDDLLSPGRTEGAVEIALASAEWEAALSEPAYVARDPSPGELHEVWWRWADGQQRAHGHVDAQGRRHGVWETWFANGAFQSAGEFLAGERHGTLRAVKADASFEREGRLEHGVEVGDWLETYGDERAAESFRVSYRNGIRGLEESLGWKTRPDPRGR